MSFIHIVWAGPMSIGLAFYLLWRILGVGAFGGIAMLFILLPTNGFVAAKLKQLQSKQMKIKDERIKTMNEILNGMKVCVTCFKKKNIKKTKIMDLV